VYFYCIVSSFLAVNHSISINNQSSNFPGS